MGFSRTCLSLALVAKVIPSALGCKSGGKYVCSEYVTENTAWAKRNGDCRYGHEAVDSCTVCQGETKHAPCECMSQEKAQEKILESAYWALGVSGACFALGAYCIYQKLTQERRRREAAKELENYQSQELEQQSQQNAPQPVQATVVGVDGVQIVENNEQNNQAQVVQAVALERQPSRLDAAAETSGRLAQQNPVKFNVLRFAFPLIFLGALFYGFYRILNRGIDRVFDHFWSFMLSAYIIVLVVSVVLLLIRRFAYMGAKAFQVGETDNPVRFMVAFQRGYGMLTMPLMGVVGLLWGIVRFVKAADQYHQGCGQDRVFD